MSLLRMMGWAVGSLLLISLMSSTPPSLYENGIVHSSELQGADNSEIIFLPMSVVGINQPPVAVDDDYMTAVDTILNVDAQKGVLANDFDAEQEPLHAALVDDTSHGALQFQEDGSFRYTPDNGFQGQDLFSYRAVANYQSSAIGTVTLIVSETGQSPVATDDSYETSEDVKLIVDAANGVLDNDYDSDQNPLQAILVGDVSNGTLVFNPDGSFEYEPAPGFYGRDTFTYSASDGTDESLAASVGLAVTSTNHAPVAVDDFYPATEDVILTADVTNGVLNNDTDDDVDTLQAILVSNPQNGALTLNPDGSFTYMPDLGFQGQDTFTYLAEDMESQSNIALVTITVSPNNLTNQPPQIISGAMAFTKLVLDAKASNTHFAVAADLDNDGDNDVAATNYTDGKVFWYENVGSNNTFTTHLLDGNLEGAYPISTGDVDGDGDSDLMAAGYDGDAFVWYRNDGGGSLVRIDLDSIDGAHSIITSDLDQDGDNDIVTASQDAGTVAWYENDGATHFTRHVIDSAAKDAKRAEVADLDGDGDLDVVTAAFGRNEIAWQENDGQQNFTKHVISSNAIGAYYVNMGDIDSDGYLDVFSASRKDGRFAWYRNNGAGGFETINIDTKAAGARTIIAIDLDRDGDVDAVGAALNTDQIAAYINDGRGKFKKVLVDADANGAYGVFAIDFDFDGDIDITSSSKIGDDVALHTQIRAHTASVSNGGTLLIDVAHLKTVDVDDGPARLIYTLTDAPDYGVLKRESVILAEGDTFSQLDVDNGKITYVNDGSAARKDYFSFTVIDGGEDGVQPATGNFTINIGTGS